MTRSFVKDRELGPHLGHPLLCQQLGRTSGGAPAWSCRCFKMGFWESWPAVHRRSGWGPGTPGARDTQPGRYSCGHIGGRNVCRVPPQDRAPGTRHPAVGAVTPSGDWDSDRGFIYLLYVVCAGQQAAHVQRPRIARGTLSLLVWQTQQGRDMELRSTQAAAALCPRPHPQAARQHPGAHQHVAPLPSRRARQPLQAPCLSSVCVYGHRQRGVFRISCNLYPAEPRAQTFPVLCSEHQVQSWATRNSSRCKGRAGTTPSSLPAALSQHTLLPCPPLQYHLSLSLCCRCCHWHGWSSLPWNSLSPNPGTEGRDLVGRGRVRRGLAESQAFFRSRCG